MRLRIYRTALAIPGSLRSLFRAGLVRVPIIREHMVEDIDSPSFLNDFVHEVDARDSSTLTFGHAVEFVSMMVAHSGFAGVEEWINRHFTPEEIDWASNEYEKPYYDGTKKIPYYEKDCGKIHATTPEQEAFVEKVKGLVTFSDKERYWVPSKEAAAAIEALVNPVDVQETPATEENKPQCAMSYNTDVIRSVVVPDAI